MRNKEYLVAVRPDEDALALHTMYFSDEVRSPGRELPELPDAEEVSERELSMAELLIESMERDWDPKRYHDTHREKVEALIEEKRQGHEIVIQEPAEPPPRWSTSWRRSTPASRPPPSPGPRQPRPDAGQAGVRRRADAGQEEGRDRKGRQAGRPPQGLLTLGVAAPRPDRRPVSGSSATSPPSSADISMPARRHCAQVALRARKSCPRSDLT